MNNIKFYFISICSLFFLITNNSVAQESLTIGFHYLPGKINLSSSNEPVNYFILQNISTPLLVQPGRNHPHSVKKVTRRVPDNTDLIVQTWDIEYPNSVPLDKDNNLEINTIRDTFSSLRNLPISVLPEDSHISSILNSIHSISFLQGSDRFAVSFNLLSKINNFPSQLSSLPLMNKNLAELFDNFTGTTTAIPFFGSFIIVEFVPSEQIILQRNDYYGFPGDQSKSRTVLLKVFNDNTNIMRSLRSGSISMIAFPSENLIEDAKRDQTLSVIKSPLEKNKDVNWAFEKKHWGEEVIQKEDKAQRPLAEFLIIRKSLELSEEFLNTFDLRNVSKGEI